METIKDSADAKKLLDDLIESLFAHESVVIEEEIMYSDMRESVHLLKILNRIKTKSDERDVWSISNTFMDMHRMSKTWMGWPENLNVQVEVNPKKETFLWQKRENYWDGYRRWTWLNSPR